jgi:hypothetical protein
MPRCVQRAARRRLFIGVLLATLVFGNASQGAERFGTADEAQAILGRAIEALRADKVTALKAFNDEKNTRFRERDLYVFCFTLPDGIFTAFESPALLGTNVRDLKLPPNDAIGLRAYDAVANAPEGSLVTTDYDFPKPGSKIAAVKQSLEVRVGNQACGVTYFK